MHALLAPPSGRGTRDRKVLSALLLVVPLVATSFALPPPVAAAASVAPGHPLAAPASGRGSLLDPTVTRVADSSALPGANPGAERFIDVGAEIARLGVTAPPALHPPLTPPPPRAHPVAHPATGYGTLKGTVLDSYFGTPVANVSVTIVSLGGFGCLPTPCQGLTDRSGGFNLAAPAGADQVSLSKPYYVDNQTWATVGNGSVTAAGIIYLVHDGYATGTLEADLPGTPPLRGIGVNASSRDGLVAAEPGTATDANGSFTVPVPPLPSVVSFTATPAYLQNVSFVNATPYEVVPVGTVYLEGGVVVRAHLYDAVTGTPISGSLQTTLAVCTRRDDRVCPFPVPVGPTHYGSTVSSYGLPGPAYVVAMAFGYTVNETTIPDVPSLPVGTVDDLGRIDLMPMGAVEITTNLSGSSGLPVRWPAGNVTVELCTLDNVMVAVGDPNLTGLTPSACWGYPFAGGIPIPNTQTVGRTAVVYGPPLRDVAFLVSGQSGTGPFTFPVANRSLGGIGFPYALSAANVSWFNLTPDRVVVGGSFDLTPGTYVAGSVATSGGGPGVGPGWSVQVCSTDEVSVCAPSSSVGITTGPYGCPTGPTDFCAPAPPGPDELVVTAAGIGANRTWLEAPRGCCAQDGVPLSVGVIGVPAASSVGTLNGSVWSGPYPDGTPAAPLVDRFADVESCLVGPPPPGEIGSTCVSAPVNLSDGNFSMDPLVGWNEVTAVASGFVTNWTWVDVTGSNTTGPIYVAPVAQVAGRVVGPDGSAIYAANVLACPLATLNLCRTVGGGLTSSDGQYNGTLPGAPFPAGVFQLQASAAGFAMNWTWVNASSGALTVAPTIHLAPLGANGTGVSRAPAARTHPAAFGAGAWVDGRLVDRRVGVGLPNARVTACPAVGGACTLLPDTTGYGGDFNTSLPFGAYHLFLNATDHANATVFVNVSAAAFLHLGTVAADADPYVAGRLLVGPWTGLTVDGGLGPVGVDVQICTSTGPPCDVPVGVDTGGFFNASAPLGRSDEMSMFGTMTGYYGTADGGYMPTTIAVNVSTPFVDLGLQGVPSPVLDLFGSISGDLRDGSAYTGSPVRAQWPVMFGELHAVTNGPTSGSADAWVGGGGNYTVFVPSDGSTTALDAVGTSFERFARAIPGAVASGVATGGWNLTLPHYGWVTANITGGVPVGRVPYDSVTVAVKDPANATTIFATGEANADGFVNVTSPPSSSAAVTFSVGGYLNRTVSTPVSTSRTSVLSTVNLTNAPGSGLGAWVESAQVNTVGVPPTTTVVDSRTYAPVQGASLTITTSAGGITAPNVRTNALGQFLITAPPDPYDTISFQAPAFAEAQASYMISGGERLVVPQVNMTGDGVVSAQVIVRPYGTPAVNVAVTACPTNSPLNCFPQTETNGAGWFWVDVPAGLETITITTENYLANVTTSVQVGTDRFVRLPPIPVYALSTIEGQTWALPTGDPIVGANVSLCSPFGLRSGCFESVPSGTNGTFQLAAPAGAYTLLAEAPEYNASWFTITVTPGEVVGLGIIFLESFGIVEGTVVNASDQSPIAGAVLNACASYVGGGCVAAQNTDSAGRFRFLAPPGTVNFDALASGYVDNYSLIHVPIGQTLDLGLVRLVPIAPQVEVSVTGRVVEAESPTTGLAGAFVGLRNGPVSAGATSTDASGQFALGVDEGSYTLLVTLGGRRAYEMPLDVRAPVGGIVVALSIMTYPISGVVTDATTHRPLGGVAVAEGGTVRNLTGPSGRFSFPEPNGSYSLSASATGYATVLFQVTVNAGVAPHDVALSPLGVRLEVAVIDRATGLAIAGATVGITTADGTTAFQGGTTDGGGNFSAYLPTGSVLVTVSASGFVSVSFTVPLSGAFVSLPVELEPALTGTGTAIALSPSLLIGVGVAAAVVLGVAFLWGRRRAPPAEAELMPRSWAEVGPAEGTMAEDVASADEIR